MTKAYINHLMVCKKCWPAGGRYCEEATELKLEYEAGYIFSLPAGTDRTKACEVYKRVHPDLYERLREKLKIKYQEFEERLTQKNAS